MIIFLTYPISPSLSLCHCHVPLNIFIPFAAPVLPLVSLSLTHTPTPSHTHTALNIYLQCIIDLACCSLRIVVVLDIQWVASHVLNVAIFLPSSVCLSICALFSPIYSLIFCLFALSFLSSWVVFCWSTCLLLLLFLNSFRSYSTVSSLLLSHLSFLFVHSSLSLQSLSVPMLELFFRYFHLSVYSPVCPSLS